MPAEDPSPPCIVVVEDDRDTRIMLELLLAGAGYRVTTANHGVAALDVVRDGRPDLILLDMRMPVMDGETFARTYRALPGPHAPIVVMAATDASGRAARIGADGYCDKPFEIEQILAIVSDHVGAPVPPTRVPGGPAA